MSSSLWPLSLFGPPISSRSGGDRSQECWAGTCVTPREEFTWMPPTAARGPLVSTNYVWGRQDMIHGLFFLRMLSIWHAEPILMRTQLFFQAESSNYSVCELLIHVNTTSLLFRLFNCRLSKAVRVGQTMPGYILAKSKRAYGVLPQSLGEYRDYNCDIIWVWHLYHTHQKQLRLLGSMDCWGR